MKLSEPTSGTDLPEQFPGEVLEDLGHVPNYHDWIMEQFSPLLHGRVAEIGAGLGTASERLRPLADQLDLVEPSPELAHNLRQKFAGDSGCRVVEQSVENWVQSVGADELDCIVMVNVLEHIEDDHATVQELFRALKPSGRIMIFVPALPFLYSKMDHAVGHFRRYTRKSLKTCVVKAGFHIDSIRYFDSPGVLSWWLINTMMGVTSFHQPSLTIYDRFIVPPTRFFESILSPPLGKNLVLIAVKEHSGC